MAEIVNVGTKLVLQTSLPMMQPDGYAKKIAPEDKKYAKITDTDMQDQIKGLTVFGETQIFKIIRNNDEKYSKNGNGIFFNLSKVKLETRKQIINFLLYCKNYESKLKNEEFDRNEYKKFLNEEERKLIIVNLKT